MKSLVLLLGAALTLSACSSVYTDNLSISSNYQGTVNGIRQNIICDNRTTLVDYSFTYTGDLASWTSVLEGVTTGLTDDPQNYTIVGTPPINGRVSDTYVVNPGSTPLSSGGGLSGQAIIVVPAPKVIGYTRVRISAFDSRGIPDFTLRSNSLPVVDNC